MNEFKVGDIVRGFKIVEKTKYSSRAIRWLGECPECSGPRKASNSQLRDTSNRLLCSRCVHRVGFGAETLPDKIQTRNRLFKTYSSNAKKRKHDFDISIEDFELMLYSNCAYCGGEPSESIDKQLRAKFNGVDRVVNEDGYSKNNCVPCCKTCNYMKRRMSEVDFVNHAKKIVEFSA